MKKFETHLSELKVMRSHHERIFYLAKQVTGNIIEIGAGEGTTTSFFLQATKGTTRITCVIDPFESGWDSMPESYGKPYPKELFLENTSEYISGNNLRLVELSSHDEKVFCQLEDICPVSLFFIDGLQYEWAVLKDLELAVNCGSEIICLDDFNRNTSISQVPSAVQKFLLSNNSYTLVFMNGWRECYLIKNPPIISD